NIYNVAKFDLETLIYDGKSDEVLRGGFDYRTSLFNEETIKGYIRTYREILSHVVQKLSDKTTRNSFKIKDLNYLTTDDNKLIFTKWNSTEAPFSENKTIHQLFEEQVKRTPDNIALVFKNEIGGDKDRSEIII